MISYISRATSLVRGSTSESTFTLMGRLPKVTSMMSPSLTAWPVSYTHLTLPTILLV